MIRIGNASIADTVKFYVDETAECIIENNVQLRDNVVIECGAGGYLRIGCGSVINYGTFINGSGGVTIGNNVLIAPNVAITSSTHGYALRKPISEQGLRVARVSIEDDVWIGANATVLAGVEIGRGTIISANAVVKFNITAESIAAGDPAVKVAKRNYNKIIFYTLPLILRNKPTLFSSIVDVYLPLANKFTDEGWECIFVGSDELKNEYPHFRHTWISPDTYDCNYSQFKSQDWLPNWKRLLKNEPLEPHDQFVNLLIENVVPTLVFCWNHDGRLEKACAENEVPLIFNELGMLRAPNPMTYFSDVRGVNARSGFSTEFAKSKIHLPTDTALIRLAQLEEIYCLEGDKASPIILILLQVHDDSNIILGSPFTSMYEYVVCVLTAIEGAPFEVVIKPHPLDEIPDLPPHVHVARKDENTTCLIARAEVVFTINSSAGFEAALAGKTVYVMGKAPYSNLGLTIDVNKPQDLKNSWKVNGSQFTCDYDLRARILDFALSHYFLDMDQFKEPSAHLARLARSVPVDPTRNMFDTELERFRQQSYILWLEAKIEELNRDLLKLDATYSSTRHELLCVKDELEVARGKFSLTQEKPDIQINLLKSEVYELKHDLHRIYMSKSWRLTRIPRGVRRIMVLTYWKSRNLLLNTKIVLRALYQRAPFLIRIRMFFRSLITSVRKKTMRTVNSKNNLEAIQFLSNRRFYNQSIAPLPLNQSVIDISIVTFNSSKWIDGFFKSLIEQDYPLQKINLCFVDNGSSDGTVEDLQHRKMLLGSTVAGFEIIKGENVGFGLGHDRGIKTGHSEFVLISNIDIIFTHDAISKVMASASYDTSESIASWELRQTPFEHPKFYDPVTQETNWSSHACVLIRRSAYFKVGGYDHQIFMYGEDVELSYRFRSYGYHLKYCPSAVVSHYTYEHANQVKPLQFAGSTLANAYLRLRYGDISDKLGILLLQSILVFRPEVYNGSRGDLIANFGKIVRKAPHFLSGRGPSLSAKYPFRGFDYEMTRDGAFWTVGERLPAAPLVTIVTRTYRNRNEFLRQAILSVMNQTYANLELIVVEDGGETMRKLVSQFPSVEGRQIRFYGMEKVGRSVTGNYGLKMAGGVYCMFLDDDDLLFADHVEVLVAALAKNPDSVGAYSLAMEVETNIRDDEHYTEVSFETPPHFKKEYDYETLLDHNFIPIQSLLFKRTLYLERGGLETDMSNLEDWNLWLRYGFGNTFAYVPKTTSLFRTPADPKVRLQRHESLHKAYFLAKDRAVKACEGYGLSSS